MAEQEQEGLLVSAARKLGHAAGRAAAALGAEEDAEARPNAASGQRLSVRARRIQDATAAKKSAAALGKSAFPDDVRYRRIMGKQPAIWSAEDVEYVNGLLARAHANSPEAS